MTTLEEKFGPGKFIASEGNGFISRDVVVLDTGDLLAGTVLGQVTVGGKWVQVDLDAVDGSQEARAVLYADADATDADANVVAITRLAEVNDAYLVYPDGATDEDKATINASLTANSFIVVRT